MTLSINCPACAAVFTPADDLRGKKAFCPKCGRALVVTGAGVAKVNEARRPVAAPTPPVRSSNSLWLVLPLLLLLLLVPGGLAVYLFTRGHSDEPKQLARNDDQPLAPAPNPQQPVNDPPTNPKEKRDSGAERIAPQVKPERTENTTPPPQPEHKEDTQHLTKPVADKPQQPQALAVKLVKTLGSMTYAPNRLAFSPVDRTLAVAAASSGNTVSEVKLWALESGKDTATLIDAGGFVTDMGFGSDGKTVALGTWTGPAGNQLFRARVWDVANGNDGKTLFTDPGPPDDDFRLRYLSPDGKVVAVGDQNNQTPIRLLNTASGATVSTLKDTGGLHSGLVFSPDSKTLASIAWQGPDGKNITYHVTICDVASGSKLSTFAAGLNNQIRVVAISPDSKTLAAVEMVGKAPTVVYWDVVKGKKLSSFPVDAATSMAINSDHKTLAVASAAGLKLYDLGNGKCIATLQEGYGHGVVAAIFSHDGKWLAAACSDKMIRLWEMPVGQPGKASPPDKVLVKESPIKPVKPQAPVHAVPDNPFFDTRRMALSRDGKTLATAGLGSDIRLWDLNSGKNFRTIPFDTGYPHMPAFLAFSPDGKALAVKFWGSTNAPGNPLWLYDVASGKHTTLQLDGGMASLFFSPDGQMLLAGQGPGMATWDVASGKPRIVPPTRSDVFVGSPLVLPPNFFDFNAITSALRPDGKMLATLGMSGNVRAAIRVWDTANGRLLGGLNDFTLFYGARGGVAFSPDGKTLLWGGGTELKLFDVANGKHLAEYTDDKYADIVSVAFSPDGKTAATGSGGSPAELKVWDLASGKATVLEGQANVNSLKSIIGVVFTPNSRTLISQSLSEVKVWDVASGKCVKSLQK
jgi:WD40 repeat protein